MKATNGIRLLSVGYSRRSPEELLAILQSHRVSLLLDIRQVAWSRLPGFAKTALAGHLSGAGIGYRHLKLAGNPFRKVAKSIPDCLNLYRAV